MKKIICHAIVLLSIASPLYPAFLYLKAKHENLPMHLKQTTKKKTAQQEMLEAWELIGKFVTRLLENRVQEARKKFPRKHETIASWRLDMENDLFAVRQIHYDKLDSVIDHSITRIRNNPKKWQKCSARKKALIFFNETNKAIKEIIGSHYSKQLLLSKGITQGSLDCDTGAYIYLAVAQVLELPVKPVYIPGYPESHMFVSFFSNNKRILNWETTDGTVTKDLYYMKRYRLKAKDFKILSLNELKLVTCSNDLKWAYFEKSNKLKDNSEIQLTSLKQRFIQPF
jgi:hypothetical protein